MIGSEQFPLIVGDVNFWTLFSYILSVVIGGVIYRFYKFYTESTQSSNQQVIDVLLAQHSSLTDRVLGLEEKVETQNKQIIEATKSQVRAEAKVELLQNKIRYLEMIIEHYTNLNPSLPKPISTKDFEEDGKSL